VPMNKGLTSPYVSSLAISSSSQTLYSATDGVYKSTDGAESWTKLAFPTCRVCATTPTVLAVDPSDPSTVYAGDYGAGVLKSRDGGATWQQTGSLSLNIVALAIDRNDPKTVYAAELGAPIAFPSGIHPASATDSGTDRGTIYKTTDGGTHWTLRSDGLAGGRVHSLAIDPSHSSILYAGTAEGVFKSVDAGSSWRASTTGLETQVNSFSLDPLDSTIYAGTADGIYKSQNGGDTWSCWNRGLGGRHVAGLARPPGSGLLYAGTNGGGVYKSADGGASWSAANGDFAGANVTSVAIDPSSPTLVYAGVQGGGVFRSENGGASWIWASTGFTDTVIHSVAVVPGAPMTVYSGTDRGVFKSVDAARSWSPTALTNVRVFIVLVDPTSPATVYAATENGVNRTVDGGNSWSLGSAGLPEPRIYGITGLAIDPESAVIYASVDNSGGLFRSNDHGATWSLVETQIRDTIFSVAIAPGRPGTIYVGGLIGIFLSRDGGSTWIGPVGPEQRIASLVIDPSAPSGAYAGTDCYFSSPGCGGVFRTIDGGETWTAFSEGLTKPQVNALAMDRTGTYLQAGTEGGVFSRVLSHAGTRSGNPRTPPRSLSPR
jgi:photosystem II stability/assembly factor-like uncharacterized protein